VCKKGYIHPAVIAAYLAGGLKPIKDKDDEDPYKLSAEERGLLALLSARATVPPSGNGGRKKAA